MPGPEFEIPPPLPPPPEPVEPVRPRRRRAAVPVVAAVAVALAVAGAGAYWSRPGVLSPPPATLAATTVMPSTTLTTLTTTTTTRLSTPGRTCDDAAGQPGALQRRPAGEATPAITLSFSSRVTGESLELITTALGEARRVLGDSGSVTVRIYCDVDEYIAASGRPADEVRGQVSAGLVAETFRGDIWIYGPAYEQHPVSERRRIVYHEYFHTVQRQLAANRVGRAGTPVWLVEGSARFFEYMVDPRDADTFRRTSVRRFATLAPLMELEQAGGGVGSGGSGEAYPVGAVACDYLVNTYGRDALQHDFWAALARTDWRSAFAEVFGTTVDDFYATFDAYRETLRP